MNTRLIAVTGGIGAGKSVVCRILEALGYDVYDCDSRAKAITDSDPAIKAEISRRVCPGAVRHDGSIDRAAIATVVFADKARLEALNKIVHGAVRVDIERWAQNIDAPLAFVETAILYQSGLDRMVDEVWHVTAPEQTRIRRVCMRNSLQPEQVKARIDSQRHTPSHPHPCVREIVNDDTTSLLLQINSSFSSLSSL